MTFARIAFLYTVLGGVLGGLSAVLGIVLIGPILLSISPLDAMFAAFVVGYPLLVICGIIGAFVGLAKADRIVAHRKQKQ